MMKYVRAGNHKHLLYTAITGAIFLLLNTVPCQADSHEETGHDLRFLLRGVVLGYEFDDNFFDLNTTKDSGVGAIGRVIYKKTFKKRVSFELNVFQAYFPEDLFLSQSLFSALSDVERSGLLETDVNDAEISRLALDRLNLKWSGEKTDITLGRQAINLANTFYFTPNDFFAPFTAQTFFRVYKSGVDAIRTDTSINELDLFTLMAVMGYEPDADNDNGWSDNPSSSRTSVLAQLSLNRWDTQWIMLGGKLRNAEVIGLAVQGEIGGWLGIRAEGHRLNPDNASQKDVTEYAVGVEHQWENSLSLRAEYFYHGAGASSTDDYPGLVASNTQTGYLARHYIALGAGYEFSPLTRGEVVLLSNEVDSSKQWAFYLVRSMSDESELAINVTLPTGKSSTQIPLDIGSEYGLLPRVYSVEYRVYF